MIDLNHSDSRDHNETDNSDDNENQSSDDIRSSDSSSSRMDCSEYRFPLWSKENISSKDHLLATIAISNRHHFTYEATLDMLKWTKASHIGDNLPTTKAALWRVLGHDDFAVTYHHYCKICNGYLGPKSEETNEILQHCPCQKCGPDKPETHLGYFIYINLEQQIQQLLTIPNLVKALQYKYNRKKSDSHALEDIYDGVEYQKLYSTQSKSKNKYNLSLTINTDGCQTSKSSKSSACPVYVMINELPPYLRKKYVLLYAIYVDTKYPIMNNYLKPFMDEMLILHDQGINWITSENVKVNSKVIVTTCCFDSPAKAAVTNLKQHNGHYGCLYCYIQGESLGRGKMVYPITSANLRTDKELRNHMSKALKTGKVVMGVKNISSLKALPSFNITKGVVIDAMHAVFLGVVKQHTVLLLTSAKTPYYVGDPNSKTIINSRLLSIKPPSCRARKPRPIEEYNNYKASEWRNWLDYAPACLENILDKKYVEHLALLSEAIHYLNSSSITLTQLARAESLLNKYVLLFQRYFGISNMTSNIHALTHLVQDVKNWGPVWTHSAFVFESWNKKIMDLLTSSNAPADQIITRYFMQKYILHSIYLEDISEETKNFIKKVNKINIKDSVVTSQNEVILKGKPIMRKPTERELTFLRKTTCDSNMISYFQKMKLNGVEYRCNQKSQNLKFCDSIVCYNDGLFGKIEAIIAFSSKDEMTKGIFVKKYQHVEFAFQTKYIYTMNKTEALDFVTDFSKVKPAFEISVSNENLYVMKIPNCYVTD